MKRGHDGDYVEEEKAKRRKLGEYTQYPVIYYDTDQVANLYPGLLEQHPAWLAAGYIPVIRYEGALYNLMTGIAKLFIGRYDYMGWKPVPTEIEIGKRILTLPLPSINEHKYPSVCPPTGDWGDQAVKDFKAANPEMSTWFDFKVLPREYYREYPLIAKKKLPMIELFLLFSLIGFPPEISREFLIPYCNW